MSISQVRQPDGERERSFGAGGSEPYARALLQNNDDVLLLRETDRGELIGAEAVEISRWNAEADATDLSVLETMSGPWLDIGCGPGRMVRAAMDRGVDAMGIDVSETAVAMANRAGLNVIHGSVFDPLPSEGLWRGALLADGNIGIGGDVSAMLRRCRELLADDGVLVVEVHSDPEMDRVYSARLLDTDGGRSASFPWAEIGLNRLIDHATDAGLSVCQVWERDGRVFCRFAKTLR
ncbi:SAM-dependent methyltransferase [Mycetocola sp. CAN_C7]|uniref:methyltransferase domain-containing protein n=1 Tax=Mycetocola sp. CAN_C7 TaxID=2787724 RepID=UPI0018CA60BE